MKRSRKEKKAFVDALGSELRYVVLTKNNRIQVIVRPTASQLRKRGKRGWHLASTVDLQGDAGKALDDAFKSAVQGIEDAATAGGNGEANDDGQHRNGLESQAGSSAVRQN